MIAEAPRNAAVTERRVTEMSVAEALQFFREEVLPLSQELPPKDKGGKAVMELLRKLKDDGYSTISSLDMVSSELAKRAKKAREVLTRAEIGEEVLNCWDIVDQWDKDIPGFSERDAVSPQETRTFVVWVEKGNTRKYLSTWSCERLFCQKAERAA